MKKKFRDITVDGIKYAWSVKSERDTNLILIWFNKMILYTELVSSKLEITPKVVEEIIKSKH